MCTEPPLETRTHLWLYAQMCGTHKYIHSIMINIIIQEKLMKTTPVCYDLKYTIYLHNSIHFRGIPIQNHTISYMK